MADNGSAEDAEDAPDEAPSDPPSAPLVPDPEAQRQKLLALVAAFVKKYENSSKQRSAQWYENMSITVGGSELAAVRGTNPYRSFFDVVAEKSGTAIGWDGGSIDCWHGILFEDVMARFIEIDCGAPVMGADICIREIPHHRNSPDGYTVVGMYRQDGELKIWTTDCAVQPEIYFIVLIEIKSPFRRHPDGKVPRYYLDQVWSGLTVSPVCHFGLFVDGVFRRCCLGDLGPSAAYDTNYHYFDKRRLGPPVAWGLMGVYAPSGDAPIEVRIKGAQAGTDDADNPENDESESVDAGLYVTDSSAEAWTIHSGYFGIGMEAGVAAPADIIDFGDCPRQLYDRTMKLASDGSFMTVFTDPCFLDGRGEDLRSGRRIGQEIDRMRKTPPAPYFYLLGVIPWKLFLVNYVPVDRRAGFRSEIIQAVDRVYSLVAAAKESGDPAAHLKEKKEATAAEQSERAARNMRFTRPPVVNEADEQDLFDMLS